MTKTASRGTDIFGRIQSAPDLASGARNGGSIMTQPFAPTIRVVTLERPFSLEEWIWVSSFVDMLGKVVSVTKKNRESELH